MKTVCGCILAKNEEKLLPGCICSLKPFVDEIIVVNNGSTDATKEIAESAGCCVIDSPDSDIDNGRNHYIQKAKTDWLLVLDADERLDVTKTTLFSDAINNVSSNIMQYRVPCYNYIGEGRFVETSTAGRIIRNSPGIAYNSFSVHASITDSIKALGGGSADLQFPIHHFDILCEKRTEKKRKKYRDGMISTIRECDSLTSLDQLNNIYVQYTFLGAEYSAIGDYETAEKIYDYVIKSGNSMQSMAQLYKAFSELRCKRYACAFELAKDLVKKNLFSDRAYSIIIQSLLLLDKWDDAFESSEKNCMLHPQSSISLLNHAVLLENVNPKQSLEFLWKAVVINPFILEDKIYEPGCTPNVYLFQDSILPQYTTAFKILTNCYGHSNLTLEAAYWKYREEKIICEQEKSHIHQL